MAYPTICFVGGGEAQHLFHGPQAKFFIALYALEMTNLKQFGVKSAPQAKILTI